jgi:hypothetical protein
MFQSALLYLQEFFWQQYTKSEAMLPGIMIGPATIYPRLSVFATPFSWLFS